MNAFENKYFVFIVSAGRTATKFFGDLLQTMIDDALSVHEPDVVASINAASFRRIRQFGFYQTVLGKLLGKTGIRNLSQNYLAGRINRIQLQSAIAAHRLCYCNRMPQSLMIESYSGWYGALEGLEGLYRNYKIVAIVRDPRDWVVSNMNWGTMYGRRDWVTRLGLGRLSPTLIGDRRYAEVWVGFSRFQKLCWAWQAINKILLDAVDRQEDAILVKFEDLFLAPDRYRNLEELVTFISSFQNRSFAFQIPDGVLERKVHRSRNFGFPAWAKWKPQSKQELLRICGPVMEVLGYK